MISALLLFAFLPGLASQIDLPSVPTLKSFSLPAADSAAVRQIYGIGVFANPASKASVSVDSGILRAEFDLASDSTEGYSANVGLFLPLSTEGFPIHLGKNGGSPFGRLEFEYRLSEKITDVFDWTFESEVYPSRYRLWVAEGLWSYYYCASLWSNEARSPSAEWKTASILSYDIWSIAYNLEYPPEDFPSLDSVLTGATGLRIEPKTLYTESGFQKGTACTRCVNPTMKHLVMELRHIEIDRLGPAGDTIPLVLGVPRPQVGVARRTAFRRADISWQSGLLQIANPARWTSVTVLGLDGRRLRAMVPSASQRLDLPPGSYRFLLRGRDDAQT